MPVIAGFDKLASVPEEQITDKIRRRVLSGKQGTMVYWRMKAGAHAAGHQHPHEQFVWMVKGTMNFRIGNEKRTMKPGDVAVIPGGVEHEGYFPEDSEVIDFFSPVREDRRATALHDKALTLAFAGASSPQNSDISRPLQVVRQLKFGVVHRTKSASWRSRAAPFHFS